MKIGIARPGYFTDKKYEPSMQTNWINYDLLCDSLQHMYGVKFVTIGFSKSSGADRMLNITGLGHDPFNSKVYRTKTQQAVTTSIMLDSNDSLLDGIDVLLMPYYTYFQERCYYYTLAYLAAEREVPTFIWDTDANFICQVAQVGSKFTVKQARDKIFRDPIYVNDDIIDTSIIDDLDLHVLSPSLSDDIKFITYFPFFPIFQDAYNYIESDKEYDVVYAGSQYNRERLFMKYYNSKLYNTAVCGKYANSFLEQWTLSGSYYKGHIPRISIGNGVQNFLGTGKVCVHIARESYNRIGHITPRVYEVLDSGTVLLVDAELKHGDKIVGKKYVVSSPEDVVKFIEDNDMEAAFEEQICSKFITNAGSYNNARIIADMLGWR